MKTHTPPDAPPARATSSDALPPDAAEMQARVRDVRHRLAAVLDRGSVGPSYLLPKDGARPVRSPFARSVSRILRDAFGMQ